MSSTPPVEQSKRKVQVVPALCLQAPAVLPSEPEEQVVTEEIEVIEATEVTEVTRPPPAQQLSLTAKALVIHAAQHSDLVALLVS